jgi:hypothetical protein
MTYRSNFNKHLDSSQRANGLVSCNDFHQQMHSCLIGIPRHVSTLLPMLVSFVAEAADVNRDLLLLSACQLERQKRSMAYLRSRTYNLITPVLVEVGRAIDDRHNVGGEVRAVPCLYLSRPNTLVSWDIRKLKAVRAPARHFSRKIKIKMKNRKIEHCQV